jgi:hypothetical protein
MLFIQEQNQQAGRSESKKSNMWKLAATPALSPK